MAGPATRILAKFERQMSRAGYVVVLPVRVLDARNFGVPQTRKRVFVLGYKPSAPPLSYEKIPFKSGDAHTGEAPSVWDAIGDLYQLDNYEYLTRADAYDGALGPGSKYSNKLRGSTVGRKRDLAKHAKRSPLTGCRRSLHTALTVRRFAHTKPGTSESVSRFYRLKKGGIARTIRAGTSRDYGGFTAPRPIHPVAPRCITVREAARLHSFPDRFQFDSTVWHGFRQVGNSVPPLMARAVGSMVKRAISQHQPSTRLE